MFHQVCMCWDYPYWVLPVLGKYRLDRQPIIVSIGGLELEPTGSAYR